MIGRFILIMIETLWFFLRHNAIPSYTLYTYSTHSITNFSRSRYLCCVAAKKMDDKNAICTVHDTIFIRILLRNRVHKSSQLQ